MTNREKVGTVGERRQLRGEPIGALADSPYLARRTRLAELVGLALDHAYAERIGNRAGAEARRVLIQLALLSLTPRPDASRGLILAGRLWWLDPDDQLRHMAAIETDDWPEGRRWDGVRFREPRGSLP